MTTEEVRFELLRGANSLDTYNTMAAVIDLLATVQRANFLERLKEFSFVMSTTNSNNKSYADFILMAYLYNFRLSGKMFLLTSDLKICPQFLDRVQIITIEEDKSAEVRNFGLYTFNSEKFAKASEAIMSKSENKNYEGAV